MSRPRYESGIRPMLRLTTLNSIPALESNEPTAFRERHSSRAVVMIATLRTDDTFHETGCYAHRAPTYWQGERVFAGFPLSAQRVI